jgi:integrase
MKGKPVPSVRTDQQVKSARPPEGQARADFTVDGVPGLQLRVNASGHKSWRMKSRAAGLVTLGTYPDVGLAEARAAAIALRAEAQRAKVNRQAGAPVLATRDRRTLADVLDDYEKARGAAVRSWAAQRRSIARVYGHLLDRPARQLSREDLLRPVMAARTTTSKRAAVYVSSVLRWARLGDPVGARELNDLVPEQARERVLSDAELRAVLTVDLPRTEADFIRALILTAQRQGDVRAMRFRDVDRDGLWTFKVQKARSRPTVVHPLSDAMLDLLDRRRKTVGDGGLVFPSRAGTLLDNMNRRLRVVQEASSTSDWSWHDLRRTSRTLMGRLGVPPHVAERCLNHAVGQIERTYDRYSYIDELRAAYERVADHIAALQEPDVVPLDRRGRA